jgi:hypothetical protein
MRANAKIFVAANLSSIGGATLSTLTASVDTKGFSFAKLIFVSNSTGTLSGTNNFLEEADAATGTYATVSGYNAGTDFTASTATNSTAEGKLLFCVDLRGRKRFLKATVTHATGGDSGGWICELSSPANGLSTAAEYGAQNVVGNI